MPIPPQTKIEYKCGTTHLLTREPILCLRCKLLTPAERPKDCKNTVTEDWGKKY